MHMLGQDRCDISLQPYNLFQPHVLVSFMEGKSLVIYHVSDV